MSNPKIVLSRTIQNNRFQMSSVEIIIPFYNEHSHVVRLVDEIFKTVTTNRYIVTLVDDGSINKSFLNEIQSAKIPGVRCLKNEENKGFGAAINLALQNPYNANIPYVCILHSDVALQNSSWLSNLGKSLIALEKSNVRMISARTNNPCVNLPALCGKKDDMAQDSILDDGFLPMYCVLAHRSLFSKCGLFQEFPYAGTEVEEYAYRMIKMGFRQAVCGSSWVFHEGGLTLKQFTHDENVKKIQENARLQFYSQFQKN